LYVKYLNFNPKYVKEMEIRKENWKTHTCPNTTPNEEDLEKN
jgi:hypothetical protein